ncbi:DHHA1 domain-containing protein, partial [Patescibacteria group bacterium]|nr:DHHA1 domain-containing protein [Patescibacteria group bacterium]
ISKTALDFLKTITPALLVALDCGIGNFQEVKIAKSLGFEIIIIDHHQILDKLPEVSIIVDPKQKGDKYPFKEFAAVGIAFKLSQFLLKEKMSEAMRKNFLELVALGTIADMMTEQDENKLFIMKGLESLENSWRPGIKEFLNSIPFTSQEKNYLNLRQKISKIISILNVRDIENKMPASFRVLTSFSSEDAEKIIEKLLKKNEVKKEKIREMVQELEELITETNEEIIFEGKSNWELLLLSSVASIICNKYNKPTFFFKKGKTKSQGTVRIPKGLDGVKAMMSCRQLLETYGGHSLAAGFSLKNENLEKFRECLNKYFKKA